MTLSDLANLSTFISGIAVAGSLIYLALQVHQNTKHTRALIRQSRASRVVDVQLAQTDADVAAAVIVANGGEPTPEEIKRGQFRALFRAQYYSHEDSFSQYRSGLMDEDGMCADAHEYCQGVQPARLSHGMGELQNTRHKVHRVRRRNHLKGTGAAREYRRVSDDA